VAAADEDRGLDDRHAVDVLHLAVGDRQARPEADPGRALAELGDGIGKAGKHAGALQAGGTVGVELLQGDEVRRGGPDLLPDPSEVTVAVGWLARRPMSRHL
jgi:hypothetical protein